MAAAAAVQAFSSETSASRESVVTSNEAKCRRSWAGVTIPAWCAPWKGKTSSSGPASEVPSWASAIANPPAPAAPASTPAPATPSSRRRETRAVVMPWWSSGDDAGHLRQRLGQRVDGIGELLALRRRDGVVGNETSSLPVLVEHVRQGVETLVDLLLELLVPRLQHRLEQLEGLLGALDVRGEVVEVGVRPDLLLAGDLAGGHLVHELLGAVAQLGRGVR